MPLLQALSHPRACFPPDETPFVIAVAGEGPSSNLHAGGFATTDKAWAILAAPYVYDPCNSEGAAGCGQAMALRALKQAYDRRLLPRGGNFTLLSENIDLCALLIGWQKGETAPPAWYRRNSPKSSLARLQRIVARIGTRMRVQCQPATTMPPVGEAARAMAFIGLRYLRGDISATDQYDEGELAMREAGL